MRKKLGFFGTAAAALAAMLGMAPNNASMQLPLQNQSNHRNSDTQKQLPPTNYSREQIVQSAGGFDVVRVGGEGIPPKYYGQHIVRKGTHKRTNKRK